MTESKITSFNGRFLTNQAKQVYHGGKFCNPRPQLVLLHFETPAHYEIRPPSNNSQGKRSELEMNLFRAPAAARAAKTLDRALFSRTLPTVAASVRENKFISKYRKQLEKTKEVLEVDKFDPIAADPDEQLAKQGRKCLILRPDLKVSGMLVL